MSHIENELNQMKFQISSKVNLLQTKLKIFQKKILNQYSDFCQPINEMVDQFVQENTLKGGFAISPEDKTKIDRFEYIKDQFVRWNDNTRRLFSKLHKLEVREDLVGKISQNIVNAHRTLLKSNVDSSKLETLKEQFNQICNYKKKSGDEFKAYQDSDFCSYIITQTFKKTYNDMNEFLATVGSMLRVKVTCPVP